MGAKNAEIPDWMMKIRAEQDAARNLVETEDRQTALFKALMRTNEPGELWERVKAALEHVATLADKEIGFHVSVTDASSPMESALRVKASTFGVGRIGELRSVYTDVFFSPGEYRIRCLNEFEEGCTYFRFCTISNSLALCSKDREIKPEEAASEIIEHLVSILRADNR